MHNVYILHIEVSRKQVVDSVSAVSGMVYSVCGATRSCSAPLLLTAADPQDEENLRLKR